MSDTLLTESAGLLRILQHVGAIDPADACVRREWALGLLTDDEAVIQPLRAAGLTNQEVRHLVALIQRHPTPAAGG